MFGRIALLGATLMGSISSLSFSVAEVAAVLIAGVAVAFGFVRWYCCNDEDLAAYASDSPSPAAHQGG